MGFVNEPSLYINGYTLYTLIVINLPENLTCQRASCR